MNRPDSKINIAIQHRPPFNARVEEILDVIAESRVAIEINGDPYRLDMEPRWIREARKRDIKFVISTDAHSINGMKPPSFGRRVTTDLFRHLTNRFPSNDYHSARRREYG